MSSETTQLKILETLVQIREQQKITNARLADLVQAGERTEFGQILRGLRSRGIITDADVERVEGKRTEVKGQKSEVPE